ncbi:riboflavin synthase [Phaeocystidibacter marisrubri]|uniref:Riboflavin synthase n=1 Tax=Phaeocystidibacter marisrubri TaxID=1577780 RepID=A0A6L3ZEV5_9FLAO|nr:riboflavin synthase [Phaeocystidibacter marisrubri]KAB2816333.1 riboflavin synthase [Phaeocystidibacter marisrubri]GGH68501.1 riboflavin synthase subunit alpha [Phaeocystidibacter marisrubri]
MFTGIVETMSEVVSITHEGTNVHLDLKSDITSELKIDQSVAHNGACLTVVGFPSEGVYRVTAIDETMKKTNLGDWKVGDKINMERCMKADGRLDGHIVQGHVDTTGLVREIENADGSWNVTIEHPEGEQFMTVPKGSICINGTSLTVVNSSLNSFSVSLIPYTWEHTNFHQLKVGNRVNLEFDILGKYVTAMMARRGL